MSLSDRLAAAARARSGGVDVLSTGLKPPPTAPDHQLTVVIGAHIPIATVEPDPAADPESVCPTCGRSGELGVVDLHRRTSDWNCAACGTMWRLTLPPHPSSHVR